MRRLFLTAAAASVIGFSAPNAYAVPILQLYVEGASYDSSTESWLLTGGGPIRLWTIGNVAGPGGKGTIEDVRLAVAYDAGGMPTISLTPTTTGGLGGFTDPSTPSAPAYIQTRTDGSVPKLGDGSALPSHGEYGAGTWWQEFYLGDFNLKDSPMADFIDNFPTTLYAAKGQINVYEVAVSGFVGTLHFDLYDHYQSKNKFHYKFAPFSHDAEVGAIPEPGTLALFGAGLAAGVARLRRRRNRLVV